MKTLKIVGNFSMHDQKDDGLQPAQEPEEDAYLRMDWGFQPEWNWNLQTNWIGEHPRAPSDTRPAVDDYFLTDTTLRYAHSNSLEFAASIRNLFDTDAREYTGSSIADDLPLPERNFYAEIRYTF